MSFQRILVAIDPSPLCPPVFAAALELAQSNKAAIMLLHCLNPEMLGEAVLPTTLEIGTPLTFEENDYQTQQVLIDKQIEEAQALLNRYREEAMSQGVPAELDCKVGEAGHQICEVAEAWGAELIVVGRRRRTGLTEAVLGSVSNYVVHHAPCSVLVIQHLETDPSAEAVIDLSSMKINPTSHREEG